MKHKDESKIDDRYAYILCHIGVDCGEVFHEITGL